MTPGTGVHMLERGHTSCTVKLQYFFKKSSSLLQAQFRQTKYNVMITEEGSICKFHDPRAGVLMLGLGHIGFIIKCIISLKTSSLILGID